MKNTNFEFIAVCANADYSDGYILELYHGKHLVQRDLNTRKLKPADNADKSFFSKHCHKSAFLHN